MADETTPTGFRVDGRRLTGRSLWLPGPGVAVDVQWHGQGDDASVEAVFTRFLHRYVADCAALGWPQPRCVWRAHRCASEGSLAATFAVTAPIDRLYAAVALAEAAVVCDAPAQRLAAARSADDFAGDAALVALIDAAAAAEVPLLWDDDFVSVGWGRFATTWPRHATPSDPAQVIVALQRAGNDTAGADERRSLRVPVAVITGTNGKTTTTRLVARIARHAGVCSGATSTDGLVIDGDVVDRGDWTGPGGARTVLRDRRVEVALLETARGGLLRRGLATVGVDVALVTNVSDDHLGEWGIGSVAEMAEAKLLVAAAVRPGGRLVVFDDREALGGGLEPQRRTDGVLTAVLARVACAGEILRYRADGCSDVDLAAVDGGGGGDGDGTGGRVAVVGRRVGFRDGDDIVIDCGGINGDLPALRLALSALPITLGGLADHNVANVIAAALVARGLGLPDAAIAAGLADFRPNAADSPGRSNTFSLHGAKILLDFGHNPDGVRRVAEFVARVASKRRLVVVGQAGDRSDAEITGLIDGLLRCAPDRWLLKAMPRYARGREVGAIVALMRGALVAAGVADAAISVHDSEDAATCAALDALTAGDLLVLLAHDNPAAVLARIVATGATEGW